ncbi:Mpo1-like protein [Noviherbaspirillum galbum]|uniref:DUF962 domain-containing protein n=1 Tax=Noviherbaspirillum galbum TaxID=2709383 RepID=A0A6B3SVY8_9BURK|nr:Mpo1-like protein [Noviherbaspirillum galbum]NEX63066.1 DUF962 domain-containing protein [Noviherbaspirillum galbum]
MNSKTSGDAMTFAQYYESYLLEHRNPTCRRLHFTGTTLEIACLALWILTGKTWLLPAAFVLGYGFPWIGHLVFEKNQPTTFQHPLYSFMGDWRMYWETLTRRRPF